MPHFPFWRAPFICTGHREEWPRYDYVMNPSNATWVHAIDAHSMVVVGGMMTSLGHASGNNFRVISTLWGEATGHWWIPLTKTSDAELWCFLWSAHDQTIEQAIERLVITDAIALIMTSLYWRFGCVKCVKVQNFWTHHWYWRVVTATSQVTVILDESICCVQINREFIGHIGELSLSTGYGILYWHR